jgi:hypothetical protein
VKKKQIKLITINLVANKLSSNVNAHQGIHQNV